MTNESIAFHPFPYLLRLLRALPRIMPITQFSKKTAMS